MKESDIIFESGKYWVARNKNSYTVYRQGITHSESIAFFGKDVDGLSLALYYCQYKDITSQRPTTQQCVDMAKKLHKD